MCNVGDTDDLSWSETRIGKIVGAAILIGMALSALSIIGLIGYGVYNVIRTFLNS